MATKNYLQVQIISRNVDINGFGETTKKLWSRTKLTPKSNIDLTSSENANYANLPNAGTNETWYGYYYYSTSSYGPTNYAPFGVQNLELSTQQTGLKFVIDLVHTETNESGNNWETTPLLRTNKNFGKFIYSPFNTVINGWVNVDENNRLKVYIDSVNSTYFNQLDSAYRNQLLVQVIGHWEASTSLYNITNSTTNCSGNNEQTEIKDGEDYTNTFTPNDGYIFNNNNKPHATCAGVTYESTLNDDGGATLTINGVSGNIIINGGAVAKYSLNLELYNCKLFKNETLYFRSGQYQTTNKLLETNTYNVLYVEGDGVRKLYETELKIVEILDANGNKVTIPDGTYLIIDGGVVKLYWTGGNTYANRVEISYNYLDDYVVQDETYKFVLRSVDGFIFKTFPTWSMGNESGQFSLNAYDNTIATINWNLNKYITISESLSIQANATLSASLKYGFISIYNPTFDEVDKLSKKRFYSITQEQMLDLSQYIISFRKLYVDIPQIARELVYFGKYNTNVSSNIVTTNFIETDCGTIRINEYNENSLDYSGVEIELYLPFIGNITLNPNEVYGKQLNLVYRTNPLNGDCVAIVYSNNKQIIYSQGNVSFEVPINFKYGNLNNYGTSDNSLYMCDLTPYIEIRTPRQYQNPNNSLLNNNLWVNMNECSGFCQFGEVELVMINNINKDAYDEIISLLLQGVDF